MLESTKAVVAGKKLEVRGELKSKNKESLFDSDSLTTIVVPWLLARLCSVFVSYCKKPKSSFFKENSSQIR